MRYEDRENLTDEEIVEILEKNYHAPVDTEEQREKAKRMESQISAYTMRRFSEFNKPSRETPWLDAWNREAEEKLKEYLAQKG